MAKAALGQFTKKVRELSLDIILPVFILSLVLEMAYFFPTLQEINVWDEAAYIHSGYQLLTSGVWPNLANSPLSSLLFALTALPVRHSPNFFVLSDAIARIILFTLVFFSVYALSRELKPHANHWVMLALILIVPVASTMYQYPSDVLFTGLSALAFWQMLAFYHRRKRRHLWWASGLMGLGMLVRAEGLLLIGVMAIVTLVIALPKGRWFRDIVAVLVPFVVLVGGYILIYGLTTGDFSTGLPQRTFNNFESGHEVIYSQGSSFLPTVSARIESNRIFGTGEENDYSVFRAIRRNPGVYLERLTNVVPSFVQFAIKAYGNKFILIFLWLSLRGLVDLIKKGHFPIALMGILWFVPLGVGILNTFFREGYFMMPYFVVFMFSSIGLTAIIQNFQKKSEKIWLCLAGGMVLVVSALTGNLSMFYRGALFIFALIFLYIFYLHLRQPQRWQAAAWWVLLAFGLIIRGGYPSPELPRYGELDVERSVIYLQDHFPVSSHVLAGAPANIWAARMIYFGINSFDIPQFEDSEAFLAWMQSQDMDAVYVDQYFPTSYKDFVMSLVDNGLQEVYATPERDILIFALIERDSS